MLKGAGSRVMASSTLGRSHQPRGGGQAGLIAELELYRRMPATPSGRRLRTASAFPSSSAAEWAARQPSAHKARPCCHGRAAAHDAVDSRPNLACRPVDTRRLLAIYSKRPCALPSAPSMGYWSVTSAALPERFGTGTSTTSD